MRSQMDLDANCCHSLKLLPSKVALFIVSVLFITNHALAGGGQQEIEMHVDTTCQTDRPLAGLSRVSFNVMRRDMGRLRELRKYVGTPQEALYRKEYKDIFDRNSWLGKERGAMEYIIHVINQEEMLVFASQVLGPDHRLIHEVENEMANLWDGRLVIDRLSIRIVELKTEVLKRLDATAKQPNVERVNPLRQRSPRTFKPNIKPEEVEIFQRRFLASLGTVYEFWEAYVPKRRGEFEDSISANQKIIEAIAGFALLSFVARRGGAIVHALKTPIASALGGAAANPTVLARVLGGVPTIGSSCVIGAVGAVGVHAVMSAIKTFGSAYDASKDNGTTVACEAARDLERRGDQERMEYIHALEAGGAFGCIFGFGATMVRGSVLSKNLPKVLVPVAAYEGIGAAIAQSNANANLAIYESLKEFNAAEKAISEGDQLLATKHLLAARKYTQQRNMHFFNLFYTRMVTKSVQLELHELKHAYARARKDLIEVGRKVINYAETRAVQIARIRSLRRDPESAYTSTFVAAADILPAVALVWPKWYQTSADYLGLQQLPQIGDNPQKWNAESVFLEAVNLYLKQPEVKKAIAERTGSAVSDF